MRPRALSVLPEGRELLRRGGVQVEEELLALADPLDDDHLVDIHLVGRDVNRRARGLDEDTAGALESNSRIHTRLLNVSHSISPVLYFGWCEIRRRDQFYPAPHEYATGAPGAGQRRTVKEMGLAGVGGFEPPACGFGGRTGMFAYVS